jgi:hypothetical protein
MQTHHDTLHAGGARPWHREPMLWLVIAIPLLTVVAGLTTVVLAYRGSDSVVGDEMRADGLTTDRDTTRDRAGSAAAAPTRTDGAAAGSALRPRPGG